VNRLAGRSRTQGASRSKTRFRLAAYFLARQPDGEFVERITTAFSALMEN
jgi:hypothetical protein